MKKVFLLAALAVSSVTFAQTSKGTWMLGGGAGYSSSKTGDYSQSALNLSPNLGYFVMNNLAIGAGISITSSKDGDVSSSATAFSPFVRYYFAPIGSNAKLFGQAHFGFGSAKEDGGESVSATEYGVGAGAAFFLNKSIALEAGLGYNSRKYDIDGIEATNTIGVSVGFQIHLGK